MNITVFGTGYVCLVTGAWLKAQLGTPVVVDGRNLYDPKQVREAGLMYFAVGRAVSIKPMV